MTRWQVQETVQSHIADGGVYDWSAAWEWSSLRRANARLEAPGAGAMRQLIDVMADLAPQGALDDVLAYLNRTGLVAVQPRLIPQIVAEAKFRKGRRDSGLRPGITSRKLRFSEINAELQASSVIAAFLFVRIGEPEADVMEAVLSRDPGPDSSPNSYLAHVRLHGAFVLLARNLGKLDGLLSDMD